MTNAYIGVGSNLGDRLQNLQTARNHLEKVEGVRFLRSSGIYETEPVGGRPQPLYMNAVWEVQAALQPDELLSALHRIEGQMGRIRREQNEPRMIDLDVLLFGDQCIDQAGLTIPHPRFHERFFVLKPLADLVPDAVHPKNNKTVTALLKEVHENSSPAKSFTKTSR